MPFNFTDVINPADPTFNQELGINNSGVIAGYSGSGVPGHPNQGYTTTMTSIVGGTPSFTSENFPGSVQTQVVGINNHGTTVGFYSPTNNGSDANYGFWNRTAGTYGAVFDPLTTSTPAVNQLLGINDNAVAAGFYNDANGNSHGYTYNLNTGKFTPVVDPAHAAASLTATAIDNAGDVAGFFVNGSGLDRGFLDKGGTFTTISLPGFADTQVLGMNNNGQLVGQAFGPLGFTVGFVYNVATATFTKVSDPNGVGATVVNGINDAGDLVGFYVNGAGNTIGLLATPTVAPLGPSVAETGATAQSFDAWSVLAPHAGTPSGLHYEEAGRGYNGLSVAVASVGHH